MQPPEAADPLPMLAQPPPPELQEPAHGLLPPEAPVRMEKPRIWSPLLVGVVALAVMASVSVLISYLAVVAAGDFNPRNPPIDESAFYDAFAKLATHLWGIALMVLPGQFTMIFAVVAAACLSSERLGPRIGYVRGRVQWWALPLLLLGTIFTGVVGGVASSAIFSETSRNLQMFLAMARGPGDVEFIGAVFLLSVVPGFVEESLFRGYIQRRLLRRWSPFAAIATSTAFFTLAHFDPQHMLGIIPLGVWLGYLAWRTGALWPGMLCHAAQNTVAMLGGRYGDPKDNGLTPDMIPMVIVTGLAFLGAVFVLQRTKVPVQTA